MDMNDIIAAMCGCEACVRRRTAAAERFKSLRGTEAPESSDELLERLSGFRVGDTVRVIKHDCGTTRIVGLISAERIGECPTCELLTEIDIPRPDGTKMPVSWVWHAPSTWLERVRDPRDCAANGRAGDTQHILTIAPGSMVKYRNRPDESPYIGIAVVCELAYKTPERPSWHIEPGDYMLHARVWSETTEADGQWLHATQIVEVMQ